MSDSSGLVFGAEARRAAHWFMIKEVKTADSPGELVDRTKKEFPQYADVDDLLTIATYVWKRK